MLQLAQRLRQQRKLKGKTQKELAELLDVRRATYGEYERGNNLPPIDKLVIIADSLNVTIDYLVGTEEKKTLDLIDALEVVKENLTSGTAYVRNVKLEGTPARLICNSIDGLLRITKMIESSEEN